MGNNENHLSVERKGLKKSVFIAVWTAVFAILLAIAIAATCVCTYYDSVITQFLGSIGGGTSGGVQHYDLDYSDADALLAAEDELCLEAGREAVVLLENDGVLPLSKNSAVSVFGMAGASGASIGTGSGSSASAGTSLQASLTSVGFKVNETLLTYYQNNSVAHGTGTAAGGGADKGDWSLGKEADFPTGDVLSTLDGYKDAAIMVLNRNGGEGGDLARTMDNHGGAKEDSYLSLSPSEKATLQGIKDCGKFKTIIVLVNSGNPLELGSLKDYGVNAVLWYGGLGSVGLTAVGEILAGDVNPSGRLPDTYVYDNFSSPAMQNFGDYRFTNCDQSYVNYAESVYVGYKYYETRYEDKVMDTQNVGNYDYDSTVLYPFGYGLTYTEFSWKDYTCEIKDGAVNISLTVENTGDVAGKDVVEIYFQSEYTDFDKANAIEKASVNLVEFAKTDTIPAGGSEKVEISFPLSDMKCYDSKVNRTYILEEGEYYITAASDAHAAANNILKAKGYDVDGDASLAQNYYQSSTEKCDTSVTGNTVTNLFDDAVLDGATYLSRSDWSVMDEAAPSYLDGVVGAGGLTAASGAQDGVSNTTGADGTVGTLAASDRIVNEFKKEGYEASGNPKDINSYTAIRTYSEDNGLELVDLMGADYDDEKWDKLLNQMKFSEIYELFGHAGYGTIEISSINKPKTLEYDGPAGLNSYINGKSGYSFPNEISMASTWNIKLLEEEGKLVGNDAVLMSSGVDRVAGWLAPAVNIHRTPFSGRNYEYYSEDGVLTGKLVAKVIKGVQSKGVYVYLKHYALNDQETNRAMNGNVATFATEQAMREIYLKGFELGVTDGGAKGIMTSMNRVGATVAAGSYALNTSLLRDEWGFNGAVITDYTGNVSTSLADQILASGGDLIMCSGWNATKGVVSDYNAEWTRALLRQAAHNTLYVQANSVAMNGFTHGTTYSAGFAIYKIVLIVLWVIVGAAVLGGGFRVYRTIGWSEDRWYARKRISKKGWIIIAAIAAAVVIALLLVFFLWLFPVLSKALVL